MPLCFLVSLLRGWEVSMWSWFWIGHIYILIIYTNTTNNIYNMLIEIRYIWYYIYSVLSIMMWELFLVQKKDKQINHFFIRKPLILVFFFIVSIWDFFKSCTSQCIENISFYRCVYNIKAFFLLNKIVMTLRTSMAHICATGTMGRLKSWHIYVPLAVDRLNTNSYDILDVLWLFGPFLWLISTPLIHFVCSDIFEYKCFLTFSSVMMAI